MHNKEYSLKLVQDKINGLNNYSYSQIATLAGYSKKHIVNLSKELNKKNTDSILVSPTQLNKNHKIFKPGLF